MIEGIEHKSKEELMRMMYDGLGQSHVREVIVEHLSGCSECSTKFVEIMKCIEEDNKND